MDAFIVSLQTASQGLGKLLSSHLADGSVFLFIVFVFSRLSLYLLGSPLLLSLVFAYKRLINFLDEPPPTGFVQRSAVEWSC